MPRIDPIFTIAPPPAARRCGKAARETLNVPVRFVATTLSQSSSDVPSAAATTTAPALLTTMCKVPKCFTVDASADTTDLIHHIAGERHCLASGGFNLSNRRFQ